MLYGWKAVYQYYQGYYFHDTLARLFCCW